MKSLFAVLVTAIVASACQLSSRPGAPTPMPTPTAPPPAGPGTGPAPIAGTSISVGQTVHASIKSTDVHCWDNWDRAAACRQFDFTAPADGRLVATLSWEGPVPGFSPELILVSTDGSYVYCEQSMMTRAGELLVKGGLTYRILVLSYVDALDFSLTASIKP
jgi:hypothetical protein